MVHGKLPRMRYLWLTLVKRVLHAHVREDNTARHAVFRGRATQPLEVLIHAVLSESGLDGARGSSAQERTAIFLLQHLHLKEREENQKRYFL